MRVYDIPSYDPNTYWPHFLLTIVVASSLASSYLLLELPETFIVLENYISFFWVDTDLEGLAPLLGSFH